MFDNTNYDLVAQMALITMACLIGFLIFPPIILGSFIATFIAGKEIFNK
jgi:hypothetical protein